MKPHVIKVLFLFFLTTIVSLFIAAEAFAQGSLFTSQGSPSTVRVHKGKRKPASRRALLSYTAEWKPGSHKKKTKINTRTGFANEPYWDRLEAQAKLPGKENDPGTYNRSKPSRKRKHVATGHRN